MRFTGGDAYHSRGFLIGTGLSLAATVIIGGVAALVWRGGSRGAGEPPLNQSALSPLLPNV